MSPVEYRRRDDEASFSKAELVEQEALAFHESDGHDGPLSQCEKGCWASGEVSVDDALASGELVPA